MTIDDITVTEYSFDLRKNSSLIFDLIFGDNGMLLFDFDKSTPYLSSHYNNLTRNTKKSI